MTWQNDPVVEDAPSGGWAADPVVGAPSQAKRPAEFAQEAPPLLARVGRGMMDIGQGIKQRALGLIDPAAQAAYTGQVNDELRLYDQGRAGQGFDWGRMGGNVAATLPLAFLPAGVGIGARAGLGAASGAAGGVLAFNPQNTAGSTAMNAALGAGMGAAANVAAPAITRGIVAAVQAIKNKVAQGGRALAQSLAPNVQITAEIKAALAREGIDWDKLPDAIRQSTMADARAALETTGALDAGQLARKADIESIAGPGSATRAQITRSPQDWTLQSNLQRTEANIPAVQRGEVPTLTGRMQAQDEAMRRYAAGLADEAGGSLPAAERSQTPFQVGERVADAVKQAYATLGDQVSEAYTLARKHIGAQTGLPRETLDGRMQQALTDFEDVIPSPIQSRLAAFGITKSGPTKASRDLTVEEGDKLLKLINKRYGSADPATRAGLDEVRGALKDAVLDLAKGGNQGAQRFQDAWSSAAARFAKFEPKPLAAIVGDKADTSKLFQSYVLGGNPNDLTALVGVLRENGGEAAVNDMKSHVVQWLTDKATANGNGPFSGTRYSEALRSIGPDRLKVLFGADEVAKLETLKRGALAMTREPAFSAPNRSNTTPALLGAGLRLANRIPGINMMTAPIEAQVQARMQGKLLEQALQGGAAQKAARDALQAVYRDRLARGVGRFNYGAAPAGLLSQ